MPRRDPEATAAPDQRPAASGVARNTAIFSVLTGLSRVAGLAREVLASYYFGTSAAFSAFTVAFQFPNVVRAFFADAALSAAFIPVYTELQEQGRRREAFQLASSLVLLLAAILSVITLVFFALADVVMPLFLEDDLGPELEALTSGLAMVMFPIVGLLAVNGILVGVLQAADRFTIPALSPVVWNLVIMAFLVGGRPLFGDGDEELYAYAVGILAGTLAQLLMSLPALRQAGFKLTLRVHFDGRVKQVLLLMLPVTISLGLININSLINSFLGFWVDAEAPRAIDAAFRIYMLPQGLFSVAIATVLFPALARLATRKDLDGLRELFGSGARLILLLLVPSAALIAALAEPMTRLLYEYGQFDTRSTELVSEALLAFSFSLPLNGLSLLLTRAFFSMQRPWATTALALGNLAVNFVVALALYKPLGIAGVVLGTSVANLVMVTAQAILLRRILDGRLELKPTAEAGLKILAGSLLLAATAWVTHEAIDEALGRSFLAQVLAVGTAMAVGGLVYAGTVLLTRVDEALRVERFVRARLPSSRT